MARIRYKLTDKNKLAYFDSLVNTLWVIRESTVESRMSSKDTLVFIHGTSNDTLTVLEHLNDASRDVEPPLEEPRDS